MTIRVVLHAIGNIFMNWKNRKLTLDEGTAALYTNIVAEFGDIYSPHGEREHMKLYSTGKRPSDITLYIPDSDNPTYPLFFEKYGFVQGNPPPPSASVDVG